MGFYLNIFLSILCLIFLLLVIFEYKNLRKTKKSLEETTLRVKTLALLSDDLRSFKHDFFNIIQAIDGYIKTKDMDSLEKYYEGIKKDCDDLNTKSILSSDIIDDSGVYNLIATKYYKARHAGLSFDLDILAKISTINVEPYILSRILGILIDNAIEAATNSLERKIVFEIIPVSNKVNITLMNSYSNKDVNLDKIYEKGVTSKRDNKSHGIGLWKVHKILEGHDNLKLKSSKSNDYFIQTLEVLKAHS